ncbi:MAG: hypothetical protein OEQ47_17285, partial [Acidimicrobiia bacterium]|nr:hypothetical protein [Acidimicrobiia bacterium]
GGTAPTTDDTTATRTAEDISVHKSVGNAVINQGDLEAWSLLVETSEYRVHRNVRLEDTVPDGLCPLGENVDHEPIPTGECLGGVGDGPTISTGGPLAPYTSVTENADGTWTLVWDDSTVPELDSVGASSSLTIDFRTRTRAFYQQNGNDDTPVLAQDSWTNTVDLQALDYVREENGSDISADEPDLGDPLDPSAPNYGDPDWAAFHDPDSSSASQQAGGPSLDKTVAQPGLVAFNCDVASATYVDGPAQQYGPGDHVCWKLRVDFQTALDTGSVEVKDFLPPTSEFVPGSMAYTPANNLVGTVFDASAASSGVLTWTLGTVDVNAVFEATFQTTIVDPDQGTSYDISENLMKMSYLNTGGQSFPLRDLADFEWGEAELDLVKGVMDVNDVPGAGNPPNTDGVLVQGGDVVTYRIDLINSGSRQATEVEAWDRLPSQFDCSMVTAISDGGACAIDPIADGYDYIQWDPSDGVSVAAETNGVPPPTPSSTTLTYDVTIPSSVAPNTQFDNFAGIVSYQSATNAGGGNTFTYVPANNIDPSAPAANTTPADDPSRVFTGTLAVAKGTTTEIDEAGNNLGSQSTIGEEITYTVAFTVPQGTTIYGTPTLTDALDATRLSYVPNSASATLNAGGLPAGVALDSEANMQGANTVALLFSGDYTNPANSGDDTFEVVFRAQVADTPSNNRLNVPGGGDESLLSNRATLTHDDAASALQTLNSNTTTNRVVEPNLSITKTENDPDNLVSPFDTVQYTLTVTNPSATRVSTAHDLDVEDVVPPGMSVTNAGTGTVNVGAGPSGEDTITWTIASLAPGASQALSYTVQVDPNLVTSSFVNAASVVGTSLPSSTDAEGERTSTTAASHGFSGYTDNDARTLSIGDPTLSKAVGPTQATIGQEVVYAVTTTIPAGLTVPDATVIDTLPEGMTFDGFGSATASCTSGCPPNIDPITPLGPTSVGAATRFGWFLGDIDGSTAVQDRVVTITYRARPTDSAASVAPVDHDNAAALHWNPGNDIGGTPSGPDPGLFTSSTPTQVATLSVIEPSITLDKSETTTPANNGTGDAGDIEAGTT